MIPIRVEKVWKTYGTTAAVCGLSFTVPPQSVYGFLGPNGAGKSTTIRMLLGLQRPDHGTITLFGHPLAGRANSRLPPSRLQFFPRPFKLELAAGNDRQVRGHLLHFGKQMAGGIRSRPGAWISPAPRSEPHGCRRGPVCCWAHRATAVPDCLAWR